MELAEPVTFGNGGGDTDITIFKLEENDGPSGN